MKTLNLLEQEISLMKGELAYLKDGVMTFPHVVSEITALPFAVKPNSLYNGVFLNNTIVLVVAHIFGNYVYFNNTTYPIGGYKGLCVFGDVVFVFYDNGCLTINTSTGAVKRVIITEPQNIEHVYQINSQLFAILTHSPTTIFIYTFLDAGNIADTPDGGSISLVSYVYSTFSIPKEKPRLMLKDDILILYGSDGFVELDLTVQDIIYIRTLQTYYQPLKPFQDFLLKGLQYMFETVNYYVFYNNLTNSFIWLEKGSGIVYFSQSSVWLTNNCVIVDDKAYRVSDILTPDLPSLELDRWFQVKIKTVGLGGVFVDFYEVYEDDVGTLFVLSKLERATNTYNYRLWADTHYYRMALKGEEFVVGIHSKKPLKLRGLAIW